MASPPFPFDSSRRAFLLGAGSAAILAACGGGDSETSPDPEPGPELDDDTLWLTPGFADGLRAPTTLVVGAPQRAPFVFYASNGLPAVTGVPATVDMALTAPDGSTTVIEVIRHDDEIPTPHYPLGFTPEIPGTYAVEVNLDGETQRLDFVVADVGEVGLVALGDPMRAVDTPTFDDALGYDPICTRFDPCPYHEHNLADVVGNGTPTALMISTPGFCQTAICGPVLELLIDIDPGGINVIHGEVYTNPSRLNEVNDRTTLLSPIVTTFDMNFEPSFVVADGDGIVTARLDYTFDKTELEAALATVT